MNHLVVLHSQVLPVLLQVGHLHEVPSGERFTDVGVILLGVEIRADLLDAQALHNPHLNTRRVCHYKPYRSGPHRGDQLWLMPARRRDRDIRTGHNNCLAIFQTAAEMQQGRVAGEWVTNIEYCGDLLGRCLALPAVNEESMPHADQTSDPNKVSNTIQDFLCMKSN